MKEMDSITLTCIAAEKAGMSYGKYVAMFGCMHKGEEKKIIPSIHSKVCPECGRTFSPETNKMKYCSKECCDKAAGRRYLQRKREKLKSIDRICVICGKKIPEARSLNAKTCSDECGEKLYMRNKNRKRAERRRMKEVSSQNENA